MRFPTDLYRQRRAKNGASLKTLLLGLRPESCVFLLRSANISISYPAREMAKSRPAAHQNRGFLAVPNDVTAFSTNDALVPPKPKEFDSATLISRSTG
jgi:hypothetical protein